MLEEFYKHKKVLITGASGFIGRHLIDALNKFGVQILVVTHQKKLSLLPEFAENKLFKEITADMMEIQKISQNIKDFSPQIVFHLASFKERKSEITDFLTALKVNVEGTIHLFESLLLLQNLESVVVLGTGEEYGQNPTPYFEESREDPVNAYSWSKSCLTHLCQLFFKTHKLPVTVLRPGLAYGPGQKDDMFIPSLIKNLKENKVFHMSLGEQTRDFVYIDDLIHSMLLAPTKKRAQGEVINISYGMPVTLADVALRLESLMQKDGLIQMGAVNYRPQEIMEYCLDPSKAKKILEFSPKTTLREGLKKTIEAEIQGQK